MEETTLKEVYEALDKPTYRILFNIAQDLQLVMTRSNFSDDKARLELIGGLEGALGFIGGPGVVEDFVRPEVREKVRKYLVSSLSNSSPVARDTMIAKAMLSSREDVGMAELYALKAGFSLGIPGMLSLPSVSEDELIGYYETLAIKQLGWYLLDSLASTSAENIEHFAEHTEVSDDVRELHGFYDSVRVAAHKAFVPVHLASVGIGAIIAPDDKSEEEPEPDLDSSEETKYFS